jgi:hypothetical protein
MRARRHGRGGGEVVRRCREGIGACCGLSCRDGIIANSAAGIVRVRCGIADCRIAAVVRVRGKGGVCRGRIAKNRVAVVGVDGAVVVRAAFVVAPVARQCVSRRREEGVEKGVAVRGATSDRVSRDLIAVVDRR